MEAELLAAIYAAPDDDAPRLVYADWLQDRGDSLGEFIALQLQGISNDRTDALQTEHNPRILGSLTKQIRWGKLARGFPSSCAVLASADPGDPRWATVSEVHGAALLDDEVPLPWLRHLVLEDADVERLRTLARPIAAERLVWQMQEANARAMLALSVANVPKLRRLEICDLRREVAVIDRIWREPRELAWLKLEVPELAISVDLADLPRWLAAYADRRVQQLELCDVFGAVAIATRDAAGALSQLAIDLRTLSQDPRRLTRMGDGLLAGIGALGKLQLTSASIRGARETTVDLVDQLQRRLAKQTRVARVDIS
jgi:uncharacterized protein (TIGR02996 family)